MSLEQLRGALHLYQAEEVDRGGVSALDILIARALEDDLNQATWIDQVQTLVIQENALAPRFWSGIRLIIDKLKLRAKSLASVIESRLHAAQDEIGSFDLYEGWRAFSAAGGYLTAKRVRGLTSVRQERPALWLDLAMIAYHGDPVGLTGVLGELAEQGRIGLPDFRPRLSQLQAAMGQEKFLTEFQKVVARIPNAADRVAVGQWLDSRIGTHVFAEPERVFAEPERVIIEHRLREAANFGFSRREPRPVVQRLLAAAG